MQIRRGIKQSNGILVGGYSLRAVQIRRGIKHLRLIAGCYLCLRAVQIRRGIKLYKCGYDRVGV